MSVILNVYNKIARKFEDKTVLETKDIESGDGYTKFPDGTLICYGKIVIAPGALMVSVGYLKEFISNPSVTVSSAYYNQKESMAVIGAESVTGCDIYVTDLTQGVAGQRGAQWQAIGRWK